MGLPVVNKELAKRLQQAEINFFTSRITSIGERSGNPMGVEIQRFGTATAYYIQEMPWALFNSVKGITDTEKDQLGEIADFYRARDRHFQIEIDPSESSPALLGTLASLGLYQHSFQSVLYGLPLAQPAQLPVNIAVTEVVDEVLFDMYAEVHCLASGMSLDAKGHFISNNIGLLHREGWKLFLGLWEGQAAAVAAMHIHEGIASCALAATLPAFRGRGLQSALLQRRLHEAYKAGCELVAGQAAYGSVSQNNMERAELQIAWTRALWEPYPEKGYALTTV
ncbi:GNAT family N-acetyltransferase [Bacillus sp. FJAT-27264]|uniref:GNAT family N-acetyltransferase n=1 Tax=Paenibacillus sp. (strain DSM 101736 / FJAT-27264) TaxID=1850362 RepID=UPI0009F61292|nr:GNAT family N-acetyltransferase [Bacillus sp. FJAT-27264]